MTLYHRYSGNDRRRFQRLDLDIEVIYRVAEPPAVRMTIGEQEIEATMINLSEGGMAIATQYNIPQWTRLFIRFSLTRVDKSGMARYGRPMEISGEVRSSIEVERGEYRLGICFSGISDKDKQEISGFVTGNAA